jgi:hypothetical protein
MAAFFLVMGLAIVSYFVATERYMADFAPTLGLIALCGWLGLERSAVSAGWNRIVGPSVAVICLLTVVAGIFVSFDYHGELLRTIYPQSWDEMERFFARFGL